MHEGGRGRRGGGGSEAASRVPAGIRQDLAPGAPRHGVAARHRAWLRGGAAQAWRGGRSGAPGAGLAQAIKWAVTPTGECRTDGQVFLDLTGRSGLLHAATLRKELAAEVKAFSALAGGELGEYGILLNSAK